MGIFAFIVSMTGGFSRFISPKWIILTGQVIVIVACLLLSFATGPEKYWQFVLPGFILGTSGTQLMYTHAKLVNAALRFFL